MKVKSLTHIAVAVAIAAGSAVSLAGTVTAGSEKYSIQYSSRAAVAVSATSGQAVPTVTFSMGTAGLSGDTVTLTLGGTTGAKFSKNSINTTEADAAEAHFGTLTCLNGAGAGDDTTLVQVSGTDTTRVFEIPAGACTAGSSYEFEDATLLNSSMTTEGDITLAVRTDRLASVIESAAAVAFATTVNELVATVNSAKRWKGQIDSAANSKAFVASSTATASSTTDTLYIDLDDIDVANDVTLDAAIGGVLTLNGNWSFLRNGTEACNVPLAATDNKIVVLDDSANAAIGTAATTSTCSSLAINLSAAQIANLVSGTDDLQVEIVSAATGNKMSAQTFTGSFAWKYTITGSAVTQTKTDTLTLGAHTATGVVAFVPYMPVGSGISQLLYLTNNSDATGTVTMTSRDSNGVECTAYPAVTATANSVINLGGALATGLAQCGGAGATNKLALTITAQLPDGGLEVYSAYNVGGNRVTVVNSTNGRNVANGIGSDNSDR